MPCSNTSFVKAQAYIHKKKEKAYRRRGKGSRACVHSVADEVPRETPRNKGMAQGHTWRMCSSILLLSWLGLS